MKGSNPAGQAALFLARYAGQVHVLIRRDELRDTMSTYLAQRLTHHQRVTVHPRPELSAVHGTSRLSALHEVGVELDAKGFVVTRDGFVTSVPGAFAVGDVRAGSVKRVATAVGEGSVVISAVHSYLAGTKTSRPLLWSSTMAETPPNDNRRRTLCHRYDASITSASPSRTSTP